MKINGWWFENKQNKDDKADVAENTLHKVGNHNRDLTAADRKKHSHTDGESQQYGINVPIDPPEIVITGQTAEKHEKVNAHRRENTVIHHAGNKGYHTGADTETAAVTNFIKLRQSKTAGFTQTVSHPCHQRQNQSDWSGQHRPPG